MDLEAAVARAVEVQGVEALEVVEVVVPGAREPEAAEVQAAVPEEQQARANRASG